MFVAADRNETLSRKVILICTGE